MGDIISLDTVRERRRRLRDHTDGRLSPGVWAAWVAQNEENRRRLERERAEKNAELTAGRRRNTKRK